MIDSLKDQVLGSLDPMIIYIAVAFLAITVIIALVKKAVVMGIIVAVLAVGVYMLAPMAKDYQENFYIGVNEDGAMEIKIDGTSYTFGGEDTEEVVTGLELYRQSSGEYEVSVEFGNGTVLDFIAPGFMRSTINNYAQRYGIPIKITD